MIKGNGHTNLVCSLVATEDNLFSLGFDKALKQTSLSTFEFEYVTYYTISHTHIDHTPYHLALTQSHSQTVILVLLLYQVIVWY